MDRRKAIRTITISTVAGIGLFSGYKWYDWNKSPDVPYLLGQHKLISALAETIIPSDALSPGAGQAGVATYVIMMIRDCTDRRSANKFIDGLKAMAHRAQSQYSQPFEACTPSQQRTLLSHFAFSDRPFSGVVGRAQMRYLGRPFFTTLKQYTAEGYCSSEIGATRALAYVPVPGSFSGCMPLKAGQPAWATH